MSWVEMADCSTFVPPDGPFAHECQLGNAGLEVNFEEYNKNAVDDPNESKFIFTNIATGLNRSVAHTVRLRMWFFQGPDNDVVEVCVDTTICHTGRSWEDYFREQELNPSRPVDSLLFRTGGTADPANAGNGFFIDNVNLRSFTYTGAAFDVAGDAQVTEGNAGPGDATATYAVTLDAPVPFETTVHYATANGTATAPSDYASTSGDLTFAPNTVGPRFVNVPINGDTTDESHEKFSLVLTNPVSHGLDGGIGAESFPRYVAVDTGTKQTTISDDDSALRINDVSQLEGNSGTTLMPFTVTLDNASAVTVTVHVQSQNGSAIAPNDYTGIVTNFTFRPGESRRPRRTRTSRGASS